MAWFGTFCSRTLRAVISSGFGAESRALPAASAGASPVIEYPPVHQTHRCHLSTALHAPGQPNHSSPAHPLQHALGALHPGDHSAIAAPESVPPVPQLRRVDFPGQRHHSGKTIDRGDPDVYPRPALAFGQCSAALRNPAIRPGLSAAQRSAAALEPKIQLLQARSRAKAQEFQGTSVARCLNGGGTALGGQKQETCKHDRTQRRDHAPRPGTR